MVNTASRDFAVVCASWITFCWFMGSSVHGDHGIFLETDSQVVTVINGSAVQLNCTITGNRNGTQWVTDDLFWAHGHRQLTSNRRVPNNRTLQLLIKSVSWDDAGDYLCRLSSNYQIQGINVSVIVGDIPSPPRIVKWENLEMHLKLYWAASSYDGGLPLMYSLKHEACDDCVIEEYKEYSFKDGLYSNVYSITRYVTHTVWIEARNSLGSSQSKSVNIHLSNVVASVYPCPPIVSLRGISRAIELHLKRDPECDWSKEKQRVFNVSYQTKEKLHLKGDEVHPGSHSSSQEYTLGELQYLPILPSTSQEKIVIGDLKPYTLYDVYVSVQLEVDQGDHVDLTHPSSLVGPMTAKTNEERPEEGPTNVSCKAVAWTEEKGKMNVTIEWKPPPKNKRNGIVRSFRVMYRDREKTGTISNYLREVDGSARKLVLAGLNASSSYHFTMQACTINQDYCTSSSRQCMAVISQDSNAQAASQTNNRLMDFVPVIVVGGVVCLITVILTVYFWKKRPWSSIEPPLDLSTRINTIGVTESEWLSSHSTWDKDPEYCEVGDGDDKSESQSSDCALLSEV